MNIFSILFIVLLSINVFANDGGEYYWGPAYVRTDTEEKIVKYNNGFIKVYDGAGKNFKTNEFAKIPNGTKLKVYGNITVGNINWSLIKYLYIESPVDIAWLANEEFESEADFIIRYNKSSPEEQYKILEWCYGEAKKGYGWVESKYLINEGERETDVSDNTLANEIDEEKKKLQDVVDVLKYLMKIWFKGISKVIKFKN